MFELKKCPFCGAPVKLEKKPLWNTNGGGYYGCYEYILHCHECGIPTVSTFDIYVDFTEAISELVDKWNTRIKEE